MDLAETDENGNENERENEHGNENEKGNGRQEGYKIMWYRSTTLSALLVQRLVTGCSFELYNIVG